MQSESLKKDLFIMERVINLNTYQPKQALYRGLQIVEGKFGEKFLAWTLNFLFLKNIM